MGFIAQSAYDKIVAQNKMKNLINNKYLKDPKDPNFEYITNKFFYNEANKEKKTKLFNVGSGLGVSIASKIAERVGTPLAGIDVDTKKISKDLSCLGYSVLAIEESGATGSKYKLSVLDSENYWFNGTNDSIMTHYIETKNNQTFHYWLVRDFYVGQINSTLYKAANDDPTTAVPVPIDSIPETRNEQEVVKTIEGKLSLFVIGDYWCRDYSPSTGWIGEPTIIETAKPTIYSCDRLRIMFDTQYMQHTEQYRIFKNVFPELTDKNTTSGLKTAQQINTVLVDYSKTGKNYTSPDKDATIEIITNENPLIDKAREYYKEQIEYLSGLISIPVEYLMGEVHQGAIGAESRSVLQEQFIVMIMNIRNLIDTQLKPILEVIKGRNTEITLDYVWEDVYIKDKGELLDQFEKEDKMRISTKIWQIMEYYNLTEEKAKKKWAEILAFNNDKANEAPAVTRDGGTAPKTEDQQPPVQQ